MYIYHDGGRKASGYTGECGDCVVRSIAIALERPYNEVYLDLAERTRNHAVTKRDKVARGIIWGSGYSPRDGVHRPIYDAYLKTAGWVWTATMGIGTGCQMRLRPEEMPLGRLVVSVSRHLVAVIDGMPYDTHDPTRGGSRCVYGFWQSPQVWRRVHAG